MNILEKVKKTITKHELIKKGDKVLVCLSGGSDSVALLDIMQKISDELGMLLAAAHVNHNLRVEAKNDEEFVKDLCYQRNIECFVKSVDVLEYAKKNSLSSELAGRKLRYDFFEEVSKKNGFNKIATAHNKNDNAESVLLHLIRGSGIDGLCGIPAKRDGGIIRPLIDVTKEEINSYCDENNLLYVQDKTNFEAIYTRNKIRLKLIPLILEDINAGFIDTITRNCEIFSETSDFMCDYAKKKYNESKRDNSLIISKIKDEHNAILKILVQILYEEFTESNENLPLANINQITELIKKGATSKTINLPKKISCRIEYDRLYFVSTESEDISYSYKINIGEKTYIKEANMDILISYADTKEKNKNNKLYFYCDDTKNLIIRNKKNGDLFYPLGMSGKKRISDLFTDLKIPKNKRDKIPLLLSGDDIIWVMGIRADRRFDSGKKLLSCEIFERSKVVDAKKV